MTDLKNLSETLNNETMTHQEESKQPETKSMKQQLMELEKVISESDLNIGPKKNKNKNKNKNNNSEFKEELLYTSLDKDQKIPKKCFAEDDPSGELNEYDSDFRYNMTIGDVEKWKIKTPQKDGTYKIEELWFPKPKSVRKVFCAMKIKRVSEVDNVAETFRMRFHIYFNWLATKEEYLSNCRAVMESNLENDQEKLMSWEPKWYPHLEFQNAIEEHVREWEQYPEVGCFRIQTFKDFGQKKDDKIAKNEFDSKCAKFIRAKLECEMTFSEELELEAFPFDCQDLSCVIHERTTAGVKCIFLPELRKPSFASIDPRYSVIDEWDLETAIVEFGDADSKASRSRTSYPMIVLRLKVKRRWQVFMWNIVFLMACICGLALTGFCLTEQDLGDRLNLYITLILTAVAFSYVVFDNLPNVPYLTFMDKYILFGYGFLVALMIETAFLKQIGRKYDIYILYISLFYFFIYHIVFAEYGRRVRREEELKLFYSSDEIEQEVNLLRPALKFDYTKRLRAGDNGRLLSFIGMMAIPQAMTQEMKNKIERNQNRLEELYTKRAQRYKEAAQRLHVLNQSNKKNKQNNENNQNININIRGPVDKSIITKKNEFETIDNAYIRSNE